ncbi:LysR substrate-binding domain-containing protein [Psychromonas sp. KJ10-10]|uniref:LysR substrate-binding domain-containing protein n=1 Tax=Psychromonas sp. KJ10-10 TaxID=3391823 RepID=UPI0039B5F0A6
MEIYPQSTGKTINDIREKRLSGGYIFGDVPDDFIGIAVMRQQITTVAPLDFDCSKILTVADLQSQHWIMMGDYCPFDHFLKQKLGSNIPSIMKTSDDGTRLELVKDGLGLSLLEKEEALEAEQAQSLQVLSELDFATTLHFVIAKENENDPVIKALMQEISILWDITH